jgi:hypothetical protein
VTLPDVADVALGLPVADERDLDGDRWAPGRTGVGYAAVTTYLLAQTDDSVFDVPTDGAGLVVWLLVAAVIVGLYVLVQRTRRRAEDEFWERKRRERDAERKRPDLE